MQPPSIRQLVWQGREVRDTLGMTARLTRDLPGFLRRTVSPDEAREQVRRRTAARTARFLAMVDRAIYGNPRSPYLALLHSAGCEPGDVRTLVGREGLEGALAALAKAGVFLTFDEMKGRQPAIRGSQRFTFREDDFDSTVSRPHLIRMTGGTSGRPGRVGFSLAFLDEWATTVATVLEAHEIDQPAAAFWWPVPVAQSLMFARIGRPSVGWFYPVHPLPRTVPLAAGYVRWIARTVGHAMPRPQRCDLDTPGPILAWAVEQLATGRPLVLWTTASAAARLGIGAREAGVSLRGLTTIIGSEAVTEARRQHVEASGARVIAKYGTIELSGFSHACASPTAVDDVHLHTDRYAVIRRQRPVTSGGPTVDALLVTGLSLNAGKVALNVEPGDYARIEDRACECLLGRLGQTIHLSEIRSFEKLTGEGVTFVRSGLEQIIEEILPARFGGTGLDYQLSEVTLPTSETRLVLRVAPSVGAIDESEMQAVFLNEISRSSPVATYQASMWRTAGTVEIRREPPHVTAAGKVLPFHLLKPPEAIVKS